MYEAMNKGWRMASGKYVAFLNSDDFYHDIRAVAASVAELEKAAADFSYAPVKMIEENGEPIKFVHPHLKPVIEHVFFTMPFSHQTMFAKRSVFEAEQGFDTNFKSAGDYDLVLRICLQDYKAVMVPLCFTTFRLGGVSDTNQEQSTTEVAVAYLKNYSKFYKLSERESKKIYCRDFEGISPELAWKLKEHKQYFDFEKYYKYITAKTLGFWQENVYLWKIARDFGMIYNSFPWQLVVKARHQVGKLFPKGSKQRKFLGKAKGTMKSLIRKPKAK
jgi:glycosyltransferase involved in cell wall biosynthesis